MISVIQHQDFYLWIFQNFYWKVNLYLIVKLDLQSEFDKHFLVLGLILNNGRWYPFRQHVRERFIISTLFKERTTTKKERPPGSIGQQEQWHKQLQLFQNLQPIDLVRTPKKLGIAWCILISEYIKNVLINCPFDKVIFIPQWMSMKLNYMQINVKSHTLTKRGCSLRQL